MTLPSLPASPLNARPIARPAVLGLAKPPSAEATLAAVREEAGLLQQQGTTAAAITLPSFLTRPIQLPSFLTRPIALPSFSLPSFSLPSLSDILAWFTPRPTPSPAPAPAPTPAAPATPVGA